MIVALVVFSGCSDYLEEKPMDFLSSDQLGDSEDGAKLLVNGALNAINDAPMFRYGAFPNVLDYDQDHLTGPSWALGGLGSGNILGDWFSDYPWNGPYTLIHRSNLAISKISAMTFDEAAKNNAIGQLQFLKAWGYFLLVRAYGPVPIFVKSIEEGEPAQQPRKPVAEVYQHIIELLQAAEQNLYSNKNANYETGRISSGSAKTLLAKVYLTMASGALSGATITVMGGPALDADKNRIAEPVALTHTKDVVAGHEGIDAQQYFTLARNKAKEIMDSQEYDLFPTYMDIWQIANRNKTEHIWSLQALSGDNVLGNQVSLYFRGYNAADGSLTNGGWIGVREHWYELFPEDTLDERTHSGVLHRWSQYGGMQYYPGKHATRVAKKDPQFGYTGTENYSQDDWHIGRLRKYEFVTNNTIERSDIHYPFLRYADVLLMFAEAENEINGGPTGEAYDALNKIRRRSNMSNIVTANDAPIGMNQQQFRSFVLEERGRELALESNRRWDLIRWGIYLQVMNAVDVDENNVVKRRTTKNLLYPIPVSEINANEYIEENNPGW
jgi:starch-binding outer membrane protein, SusD/RagB family